jgi:hypothetical protein
MIISVFVPGWSKKAEKRGKGVQPYPNVYKRFRTYGIGGLIAWARKVYQVYFSY